VTVIVLPTRRRLWRGRRKPATPVDFEPIEIRSIDSWRYEWHRAVLQRCDLSRSEIAIAGALMHAYQSNRGYAEIALTTLALHAGCTRRAAITAIARLRGLGLIAVLNENVRVRGRRLMATHRYQLIYRDRGVAWGGEAIRTT
jgi:hypothetical protein